MKPFLPSITLLAFMAMPGFSPAAEADTIVLKNGARITGTIVKRTDQRVWIDIGPDVIELNLEGVDSVEVEEAGAEVEVRTETLFSTARNLPELSPREHAKRIGSAVIKVSTPSGLGSGVIISSDGHAITDAHVIQGETAIKATVWFAQEDGTLKRLVIDDIEIVAINNHLDLGLLKITHPDGGEFTVAPLEFQEIIELGQGVFAIGNPLGLERSLSQGVIATTQRNFDGLTYVQTTAAINPGNSGGPLFNTRGEVIGITNMGILGGEALGFAIPTRYVKDFIRNREAFAYDKDNPNSGHHYHMPPPRKNFEVAPELKDGTGGG